MNAIYRYHPVYLALPASNPLKAVRYLDPVAADVPGKEWVYYCDYRRRDGRRNTPKVLAQYSNWAINNHTCNHLTRRAI